MKKSLVGFGITGLVFVLLIAFAIPSFTQITSNGPTDGNGYPVFSLGTLLNVEVPATSYRYISVGTSEDKHTVKATGGTIFSITATNSAATVAYLRCENDTSGNTTPGSETPELDLAIPGATTGAGFHLPFPLGFAFSAGWTCWIVTGVADTDVAEVGANVVKILYTYK
jgi:hypothetical protein